ncbi:PREDICTED: polyamine oxidase-like isoform X1 [Populus euphratica]|uniref:Polyamine oxidase-like isoform X1 n=1 Tax=Populus euphratica TaxID=75702 RepID=A0AAJ6V9H6_POPEU|nr:PREDICTED: polyamine oxidase-like isoform X1 [Populus euphratica]XP_011044313.1 PREDICTED: polyamine oxidase-like isoform X1 [Populus euphratica]
MKLLSAVLVLAILFLLTMTSASPSPTVIIIGAGMSGILAAKTLHDSGIQDILILEANSKIGGRIHSVQFRGHTVELGANWVIGGGPRSNHLYEIASKLNLKTYLSDYGNISANIYKQEGGLYPKHIVSAALEVAETRDQFCTSFSTRLSAPGHDRDDVSILVSQRLFKKVPTTPLDMVIDYFYNDYEDAEPPRVTSLKNTIPRYEFLDFGDQTYFLADSRGFESILIYIAKQFLSHKHEVIRDQRLKLNKVVREINYSKSGVQVKTEDGSVYQAKYVIVSVSVGVLQSDLIVFKPHLPQWKTQAIYEFDMAVYTKIFLRFPYKFWPSGPETEFFLYAHEKRGYYPIWQHLETEMPGSNILFVTVTDEEAKRIEQQPDIKIQEEIMDVLKKMFGNDIPEPEEILIPRWWSNRFFKGSFSNWPIGYSQRRHMQLKEPVGRIYFCGEHTYSRYLGYADAAYFAGIETANHLIKCLKHEKYCNGYDRHSTIERLHNEDPYDPDA